MSGATHGEASAGGHGTKAILAALFAKHVGPEELLIAAKVEFYASLDNAGVCNAIGETEARIRLLEPNVTLIYLEPAIHNPTRT